MEFLLTRGLIALVAATLSLGVSFPIFRVKTPYAKPVAVMAGILLFVFLCWAFFVFLIVESARRGHPF